MAQFLQKCEEERRSVDCSTVELWRKAQLLQIIEGYEPKNVYSANETGLFVRLPHYKALIFMLCL